MARISTKTPTTTTKRYVKKKTRISNDLVESFIKKNNQIGLKILFYISNCCVNLDEKVELHTIKLDTDDVCKYCNIDIRTLKANIIKMNSMSISITDEKSKSYISCIPKAKFDYNGNIEIRMFEEILKLVTNLKKRFTIIDIPNIMKLEFKHSIKFLPVLEMISNFHKMVPDGVDENGKKKKRRVELPKVKEYELDELNLMFDTKYKRYSSLAKEVLDKIQEELDRNSKLTFEYILIKDKPDLTKVGRARIVKVRIETKIRKTIQGEMSYE